MMSKIRFLTTATLLLMNPSESIAQEPATISFVVNAGIERFCEGDFLPSDSVTIKDYAERWSNELRIIVRYNDLHGSAELVPKATQGAVLIDELTHFLGMAAMTKCPAGVKRISVTFSVRGLQMEPDGSTFPPIE